ncbi:MAG: TatD family hydrolase [Dehalococcoidales bacterium]|nr:TatD family hydrolase [Dehalococcoidales bacterium]
MYELIDSHAHIDEIEDIDAVISKAKQYNIISIIAVGTSFTSNRKIMALAEEYKNYVYPALGLFPWNIADDDFQDNMNFIRENINRAIGMGEIGLDYSKGVKERAAKETQKSVFRELLKIAKANNKPALIHSRYSWQDCLKISQEAHIEKAVFHWYTGPLDILDNIIDSGYYISASPAAEYHEEHRKAIKTTSIDRLLLETDSPVTYRRGTEFEYESRPADVIRTLNAVSGIKNMDKEVVAKSILENTMNVFSL